jgi:integrator complex subunit 6
MESLKNLEAGDLTDLGSALKETFELVNQYRLQTNVDNYGSGRFPFCLDPCNIIIFTDGCALTSKYGILDSLTIPNSQTSNSQLTKEPFRWDQRVKKSFIN